MSKRLLLVLGVFLVGMSGFARKISYDIFTGHPTRVVVPGKEQLCYASVELESKPHYRVNVSITVRDLDGNIVAETQPRAWDILNCRYQIAERIPVPKKYGVYYASVKLDFPKDPASNCVKTRSFVYLDPTGHKEPYKKGQFMFSMMIKCGVPALDIEPRALETIGVRFVREGFNMTHVMSSPDVVQMGRIRMNLETYKEHGITGLLLMGNADGWAIPETINGEKNVRKMPDVVAWRKYCHEFFTAYGDICPAFEFLNEPDLPHFSKLNPQEYLTLAKIALEEQKKCAPNSVLMSSGFCNFDGNDGIHEKVMTLCKDMFAVHCFHGHGPYYWYKHFLSNGLFPMRKRIGIDKTMPWFAHETAVSSTGYGEKCQGTTLYQKIIYTMAHGGIGYTWYDFRNDGFDLNNSEHNYGIVTNDYYPKPAYIAYNTVTGLYNGNTSFVKELSCRNTDIFLFKRDANLLAAMWSLNPSDNQIEHTFATDAREAWLVDWFGNATQVAVANGQVTVPVTVLPQTLKLVKATRCEVAQGAVMPKNDQIVLAPGKNAKIDLTVTNTNAASQNCALLLTYPEGISGEAAVKVALAPGEKKSVSIPVMCAKTAKDGKNIGVKYTFGKQGGQFEIAAKVIVRLPREYSDTPVGTLDSKLQMREYFDANPGTEFRLWRGVDDLSAKVYMAATRDLLKVKVVVKDDKHVQGYTGGKIYNGDSVQFILQEPGKEGFFQFGCALANGKTEVGVWRTKVDQAALLKAIKATVTRDEKTQTTVYELMVPWKALKIQPRALKEGFRFNVTVNDSDFDGERDASINWADGTQLSVPTFEKCPSFEVE